MIHNSLIMKKWMLVSLLATLLVLFNTVDTLSNNYNGRQKRRVSFYNVDAVVGNTVSSALDAFEDAADFFSSKIYMEILNYSKWPLSKAEYKLSEGSTTQVPSTVLAGYKEAWAGEQDEFDSGTEGIVAWSASPDRFCMIYWRVESDVVWRDENRLGLGCVSNNNNQTDIQDTADLSDLDFLEYQNFEDSQSTMQFCDEKLCLQGIMSSSHKCEGTIAVIPIDASDLAPSMADEIDQTMIDEILEDEYSCKLGCVSGGARIYFTWHMVYFVLHVFFTTFY